MPRSVAYYLSVDAKLGSHRQFSVCVSHMGRVFSITLRIMLSRCGPRGVWFLCFLQIIELLSGFWNVDILFESSILFLLILPGAEERAQKEVAEKEQELLRQKQKEQQKYMEAQEKRNKENLEQLRRKLEQEREQDINCLLYTSPSPRDA